MQKVYQCDLPLLVMNSLETSADALGSLGKHTDLAAGGDVDFLQSRAPKILSSDGAAAYLPQEAPCEWCSLGSGDLYSALLGSGTLDRLLLQIPSSTAYLITNLFNDLRGF